MGQSGCLPSGRHPRSPGRQLAAADQGCGRNPGPVSSSHRRRADAVGSRRSSRAHAGRRRRPTAFSGRQHALHLRQCVRSRTSPHAVFRDFGQPLDLPRRLDRGLEEWRPGAPRAAGQFCRLRRALGAVSPRHGLFRAVESRRCPTGKAQEHGGPVHGGGASEPGVPARPEVFRALFRNQSPELQSGPDPLHLLYRADGALRGDGTGHLQSFVHHLSGDRAAGRSGRRRDRFQRRQHRGLFPLHPGRRRAFHLQLSGAGQHGCRCERPIAGRARDHRL